jgi:hypothetical protein
MSSLAVAALANAGRPVEPRRTAGSDCRRGRHRTRGYTPGRTHVRQRRNHNRVRNEAVASSPVGSRNYERSPEVCAGWASTGSAFAALGCLIAVVSIMPGRPTRPG